MKLKMVMGLTLILLILSACNDTNQAENNHKENNLAEEVDTNNNNNNKEKADNSIDPDEDIFIEGKIITDYQAETLTIEGETNLAENYPLIGNLYKNSYWERSPIEHHIDLTVQADGSFSNTIDLKEDFLEKYNETFQSFEIISNTAHARDETIKQRYGENGENLNGPLVYQKKADDDYLIQSETNLKIDSQTIEHEIKMPERLDTPEDMGDQDIWIDAEVVDNDHAYLYVSGKTNILEGTSLSGGYYTNEEKGIPQNFNYSHANIQPDGSFFVPVKYKDLSLDGVVEFTGVPADSLLFKEDTINGQTIVETYGKGFEQITGDFTRQSPTKPEEKEIYFTIDAEGLGIDIPDDSSLSENDGEIKLDIEDDVLFDFGESKLKKSAQKTLDQAGKILAELDDGEIIAINGHTDNQGGQGLNQSLSEERAAAVAHYLKEDKKLKHLIFEEKGYGMILPIASNDTEKGRAQNRRVEIVFQHNQ